MVSPPALQGDRVERAALISTLRNLIAVFKRQLREVWQLVNPLTPEQRGKIVELDVWGRESKIIIDYYFAKNYFLSATTGNIPDKNNKNRIGYWLYGSMENQDCSKPTGIEITPGAYSAPIDLAR